MKTARLMLAMLFMLPTLAAAATFTLTQGQLDANQAAPGDTVILSGKHTRTTPYVIRPGVTYTCAADGLTYGEGRQFFQIGSGTNGQAFDMKGAKLDGIKSEGLFLTVSQASNFVVQNCDIGKVDKQVANDGHAVIIRDASNFKVTRNKFHDQDAQNGNFSLVAHQVQRCEISFNTFERVREAIQVKSWIHNAASVIIRGNFVVRWSRMGIEVQERDNHTDDFNGFDGLLIEGNWVADPSPISGNTFVRESFAGSIVPDGAINTVIRGNFFDGNTGHQGYKLGGVYGLEHRSRSSTIENNRIDNFWVSMRIYRPAIGSTIRYNSGSRFGQQWLQTDGGNITQTANDFAQQRTPEPRPVSPVSTITLPPVTQPALRRVVRAETIVTPAVFTPGQYTPATFTPERVIGTRLIYDDGSMETLTGAATQRATNN